MLWELAEPLPVWQTTTQWDHRLTKATPKCCRVCILNTDYVCCKEIRWTTADENVNNIHGSTRTQ